MYRALVQPVSSALFLLILAMSGSGLACAPGQDLRVFPVEGEQTVAVPGKNLVSDPLSSVDFAGLDDALSQSVTQTFTNQGIDANDVDDFHVTALSIEVTAPLNRDGEPLQDLRFLDKLSFRLGGVGLDDVILSESADAAFAPNVIRYEFPVDTAQNLKAYLAADSMSLSADAQANDRPSLGCDLHIKASFAVQVNPLGLAD